MNLLQRLLAFLLGLKPLATEIALLIEKQNEDGIWTGPEKLIVATEFFKNAIYLSEPWYLKLVPLNKQVEIIRWCITEVCEKIKNLKK